MKRICWFSFLILVSTGLLGFMDKDAPSMRCVLLIMLAA